MLNVLKIIRLNIKNYFLTSLHMTRFLLLFPSIEGRGYGGVKK